MKIIIPKNVRYIIDTIEENGHEAYIVGGCVRDQLLKKKVSDYDITTDAKPELIKKIFTHTVDTGIKHGTVTILIKENNKILSYEVTTFREDGEYDDHRHPTEVQFVDDLYKDLSRRDFTINAMAYNEKFGLIDNYEGTKDLNRKIIKAVGNPTKRFEEDALRMLRAIRFAAKLGFDIEEDTKGAILKLAESIKEVSKERIQIELNKTLLSDNPDCIELIFSLDLYKYLTPSFKSIRLGKVIKTDKLHIAYASLLYENRDIAYNILKELKLDNETIKNVTLILSEVESFIKVINGKNIEIEIKKIISDIGYDLLFDLVKIVSYKENINLDYVSDIVCKYEALGVPIFIKDLNINGNDLSDLGYSGKDIGDMLLFLQRQVHIDKNKNVREELINIAKEVKV